MFPEMRYIVLMFPKLQEPYRFAETALRDNTGTNFADHGCDILFCGRLCAAVIRTETVVFPISAGKNFYREI